MEVSSNSNDSLQTWRKPCFFQPTMEVSSNDSLQPIVYQSRGASSLVALGRAHHDWRRWRTKVRLFMGKASYKKAMVSRFYDVLCVFPREKEVSER